MLVAQGGPVEAHGIAFPVGEHPCDGIEGAVHRRAAAGLEARQVDGGGMVGQGNGSGKLEDSRGSFKLNLGSGGHGGSAMEVLF